jgi:hypothetical protein
MVAGLSVERASEIASDALEPAHLVGLIERACP